MILYCYVSHKEIINKYQIIINDIMKYLHYDYYKIFIGGNEFGFDANINSKVVSLCCEDSYEFLPDKIHHICKYINKNEPSITHICKLDCSVILKQLFPMLDYDYYGYVADKTGYISEDRRYYHIKKCSSASIWAKKTYEGSFIPYCWGGMGYVLSKKSIQCIANNPPNHMYDIYEDLYVSQQLFNRLNILPKHINTTEYFSKL